MSDAVHDVKCGLSIRKAAQKYAVPKSSLNDRVTGRVAEDGVWGGSAKFTKEDEVFLAKTAKSRAELGIGFSKPNFLRAAGELAKSRGVTFKNGKPSEMWWRRFKGRQNDVSLRTPEATSSSRHIGMTRERVTKYFNALGSVLAQNKLENTHIWNMDETGISLSHKPGKVIAAKGSKAVHAKTSGTRDMITVIACGNANGDMIPPHFVVPGKTKRSLSIYDTASLRSSSINNANISVSDSGWTKDGIGRLWFESTFIPSIGESRPQLLICDGHGSHNNIEFIELARSENIIIIELPSHTSNWTQPLDRTFFKPLKSAWNKEVDAFVQMTGVPVSKSQFFRLFARSWETANGRKTVANGFSATGIHPLNMDAIPSSEAYSPSALYNDPPTDPIDQPELDQTVSVVNEPLPTAVPDSDVTTEQVLTFTELSETNEVNVNTIVLSLPLHNDTDESVSELPLMMNSDGSLEITATEMTPTYIDDAYPEFSPFKLPTVPPKNVKKRARPETQYFVITADQAYEHKKRTEEKKITDAIAKEERKVEREKKKLLKANTTKRPKRMPRTNSVDSIASLRCQVEKMRQKSNNEN